MQYLAPGRGEITADVATLFLARGELKRADLLERGDEILLQVLADVIIGEGLLTEGLGIVSGKLRIFEIARDVEKTLGTIAQALFPQAVAPCKCFFLIRGLFDKTLLALDVSFNRRKCFDH
jgi:hypothetical protein